MNEITELLRETGKEVREYSASKLPNENPEEKSERIWRDTFLESNGFNAAVIGEEGTHSAQEKPDYAFLVDPLDGTSGAVNGNFPWVTTAVTVLEDVDANENNVSGRPVGSYIGQINYDGEFYAWNGEPSINGNVRSTDITSEDDVPGVIDGAEIRPRDINSFEDLESDRKGLVSTYAAKKSRRTVREHFLEPLEELSDPVRIALAGGSYTGASTGWGKTIVAAEPKPTYPTEAAGEVFASAMGASSCDIYGEDSELIEIQFDGGSMERSYSTVVASTENLLDEVMENIEVHEMEKSEEMKSAFKTYRELREV